MSSSPFILKSFSIYESVFYNRPKSCVIRSALHKEITGFSRKNNKVNLIKAALGEFQERLAGMKSLVKSEGDIFFEGFNLTDGHKIGIPADFIVYDHTQPVFENYEETNYTDSSGSAAHTTSEEVLKKAYLEFVERQSLVYSWLSQHPGEVIDIRSIPSFKIKLLYNNLKSVVDNLYIYEISIVPEVYVILTLGYVKNIFSVGLGAGWNLIEAIQSSLDEFIMIFESMISNRFFGNSKNSENLYVQEFYNKDINVFLEEVHYFLENDEPYNVSETSISGLSKDIDILQYSIGNMKKKFGIDIYATFISSPDKISSTKIVKVFSPDAYPHINTKLFDPNDYKITDNMSKKEFPNIYKMVPFA